MACIHYKFKNSLDFDSITFDGLHISVRDLKEAIMQRKKLNDSDMDLLIINALNAKAYKDEEEMIPKNASVIVARIPLADAPKSKGPKTLNSYKEDPKPIHNRIAKICLQFDASIANGDFQYENTEQG